MSTLERFNHDCLQAHEAWEQSISASDYEHAFVAVLQTLRSDPDRRNEFAAILMQFLRDHVYWACELIGFCMHELRWEEIRAEAEKILHESTDIRIKMTMADVIDSFTDGWASHDMYVYFAGMNDA